MTNKSSQLVQMNISTARFPLDDRRMIGFVSQHDDINQLAERSPGFVWRFSSNTGDFPSVAGQPLLVVNLSVWESIDALFSFVYKSSHKDLIALRGHWFERPSTANQVLWWVSRDHRPDVSEGIARLDQLRQFGPTAGAFSFKAPFPAPD